MQGKESFQGGTEKDEIISYGNQLLKRRTRHSLFKTLITKWLLLFSTDQTSQRVYDAFSTTATQCGGLQRQISLVT